MRTTARGVVVVLVSGLLGVLAACSHDTLKSGTEALTVTYNPSPSGAGRYERASMTIATVRAVPSDPDIAALYGNQPLQFRFDPFTADLTQAQSVTFAEIGLSPGSYYVSQIDFSAPNLVDENISPTPATCLEGVAAVPSGPAAGQVPPNFSFVNPPNMAFDVKPGQSKLALTVNIPGLISGFEGSFTCRADCGGGQPCLISFDEASYRAAVLANVTLQ